MSAFIVHALPAGDADACAPAGRAVVAAGREPCRRCLRNARPGEQLLLLPYDPFLVRSPYTGEGPVYVHADGCDPHQPDPRTRAKPRTPPPPTAPPRPRPSPARSRSRPPAAASSPSAPTTRTR